MVENVQYASSVRTLIGILRDGEKGFQDLGQKLQEPVYRTFFLEESRVRAAFAAELDRALEASTGNPGEEEGTVFGTVHRLYADLKTSLIKGDYSLLDTTERCERVALKLYEDALEAAGVPEGLLGMLAYQAGHVRRVYEMVKGFRDEVRA